MDVQHLGDDADHVERLGGIGHASPLTYCSRPWRGATGRSRSSSRTSSSGRASRPFGSSTRTVTRRSPTPSSEIGRASCRGRGEISGGAGSFKKKKKKKQKRD